MRADPRRGHQAAGGTGGAHAVGGKDSREKWLCISYTPLTKYNPNNDIRTREAGGKLPAYGVCSPPNPRIFMKTKIKGWLMMDWNHIKPYPHPEHEFKAVTI